MLAQNINHYYLTMMILVKVTSGLIMPSLKMSTHAHLILVKKKTWSSCLLMSLWCPNIKCNHCLNFGYQWEKNIHPSVGPIKFLVIFSTTYLCEKTFSGLSVLKTKQWNQMDVNAVLRLSETTLQPLLSNILAKKQQLISH